MMLSDRQQAIVKSLLSYALSNLDEINEAFTITGDIVELILGGGIKEQEIQELQQLFN